MAFTPKDSTEKKRRSLKAAALLLGTLVGLGTAGALGLWSPQKLLNEPVYLQEPGHQISGHRYLYDPILGWRNIPNWSATTFGQPLRINSQGLRGKEYSYKKPAQTTRILVLGDSYAWGYGVSNQDVFTQVMERQLVKEGRYEVINTGVSGWGTDQQYLYLHNEGFQYSPDIVVVAFYFMNDFEDIRRSERHGLQKPVFVSLDLALQNVPVPRPDTQPQPPLIEVPVNSMDLALSLLKAMATDCKKRGIAFVVAKFGTHLDADARRAFNSTMSAADRKYISTKLRESQQFEKQMNAVPNLDYLNLDNVFESSGFSYAQLMDGNTDHHWNVFAHRHVALALIEFLKAKEHLPAQAAQ